LRDDTWADIYPASFRGNYDGDEATRLATLKFAAIMGAPFIDVEFKSSDTFFASENLS
jgi:hypothetical protein